MRAYKFEAFTSDIQQNIRDGIYKPGHKLPSVRELQKRYKISISTIQNGYEHLVMLGLVVPVAKSGYYVAMHPDEKQNVLPPGKPVVRDAIFEKNTGWITSSRGEKKIQEFNVATPGDLIISQKLLLRTMQQIIREKGVGLLRYYPSNGSEELKSNIVKHAAGYKTRIDARELVITDGAIQALYIGLSAVCRTGDVIAVESPCVFSVLEVIRVLGLKVIEVPINYKDGFDVDFFKRACRTNKIRAVVVTPNFHNPTGLLLSDEAKRAIVDIALQHNVVIIENDIYGDLYFSGTRPSTLKSYDESGSVMTYSSYAKTLAPGIRLGWLSSGKFLEKAEQIRFSIGSTVSPVYQETVNRLLSTNSYNRHVRSFRMQLAKNAYFTINLLAKHFPEGTFIVPPAGGYNIWVQLPGDVNIDTFYRHCEKIGVKFTPGNTFSFSGKFAHNFRIVFADKYSPPKIRALKAAGNFASR